MHRTLTLVFLLLSLTDARAQCPTPDLVQVTAEQRAAVVAITNIDSTVDSVQVLLGDEFFSILDDTPDSVYTFTDEFQRRGFILYDLEPGTAYRVVARSYCGGVGSATTGRGELFRTDSVGPPSNDERAEYKILAGAAAACGYLPATTRDATASEVPDGDCAGAADDDVWFNLQQFYDDYGFRFRPVGGTDQDIVVEVYDVQERRLACIDAGGVGEPETYEVFGLAEDEERYFRVYTKGTDGYADFEYCNFRLDPAPVAEGMGCITAPPVTFDGQGQPGELLDVVDSSGALIVSIENTQPLGEVNVSFYGTTGEPRQTDTTRARYANRNISIVPTTQPTDTIGVRLYLSADDVATLISSGAITAAGELDVTKVPAAVCSAAYPGGGKSVRFRGAGRFGDGYYVDIGVAGFSEFFIHPVGESLTTTTSITANERSAAPWGIFPNPVTDRLTLTVPAGLEGEPVNVTVFGFTGQRLTTLTLAPGPQPTIATATWPRGMYTLVLGAGETQVSTRILKE